MRCSPCSRRTRPSTAACSRRWPTSIRAWRRRFAASACTSRSRSSSIAASTCPATSRPLSPAAGPTASDCRNPPVPYQIPPEFQSVDDGAALVGGPGSGAMASPDARCVRPRLSGRDGDDQLADRRQYGTTPDKVPTIATMLAAPLLRGSQVTAPMRGTVAPLVKLSIFLVATIVATYVLAATITNSTYGKSNTYRADFTDVTGRRAGDDVRIAGVRVGTVKSMKIVTVDGSDWPQMSFSVQASRKLPLLTARAHPLPQPRRPALHRDRAADGGRGRAGRRRSPTPSWPRTPSSRSNAPRTPSTSPRCSRVPAAVPGAEPERDQLRCRRRSSRRCKANPARSTCSCSRPPISPTRSPTRIRSSAT